MCAGLLKIISISCGSTRKITTLVPIYPPNTNPYVLRYSIALDTVISGDSLKVISAWPNIGVCGGPEE